MKRLVLRVFLFLLWAGLLAAGGLAFEAHRFLTTPASETPQELVFTIESGATFDRVAWDLKKAGVVTDVPRFRFLAWYQDALGKVRAGEYLVNTGWTPEQVLRQITEGRAVLYRLSVREGLTWWETARAVEEQGFARFEDFKAVIHDPAFLKEYSIPFANAEGFLYPETYLLKKPRSPLDREQARDVAAVMVSMFWKKTEPLWKAMPRRSAPAPEAANASPPAGNATAQISPAANATAQISPAANATLPEAARNGTQAAGNATAVPASGATNATAAAPGAANATAARNGPQTPADVDPAALRHLVILASLVEKETGVPSERGLVAGVYANRLRLGMLLQCDPTIIYGVGETFTGAIRRSQIDDPKNRYNTYQHPGLPPGPICSSGFDALKAAAAPEKHNFLYFVATGLDGGHTFSRTLSDHNKAVQVYRQRVKGQ